MLTLDPETTSAPSYSLLNASIQETFTSLDRFEWQAVSEVMQMRDKQLYLEAGYADFKEYCQRELSAWGGYRRITQLLGAKKVIDTVGELGEHIKNERQARPLLRLVKEPDKLREAVAIAIRENPSPNQSDFAAAAQKVVPRTPRPRIKAPTQEPLVPKNSEPLVPQPARVTVTSADHPRHGESGTIEADPPNYWQQIVTFADGSRELVNNADLDAPSVPYPTQRTYPKEYAEAIAAIEQQYQQKIERLEQELRIGLQSEATAKAEQQMQEQLSSWQQLYQQQKEQIIQMQQRLDEMEALRKLGDENEQLKQRNQELENAVQERPSQQWGNTLTKQAAKALNKEVMRSLDQTIDLRSLAQEPPKENAQECLRLMGIALGNLATAMNNTQALQAAALILGTEPNKSAIAYRAEQLQLIPQAVSDIRAVLAKPGCSWPDYLDVAREYEVIEQDYLAQLTPQEVELITALEKDAQPKIIGVGSIVAHADIYSALYNTRGEVIEDLGDEVWVAWEHWKDRPKKTDRYFKKELRLL
ncbi:OmpH family outer membrane protein [Anabaena azotica]|uniref:ATPase involved in DNA repair n=1 Tax=Anabaena azotica FACHB-119 TaxID=947527 RepID=A0ABR8DBR9_9NOST|nr:OmpH family outer membrane protein [Anabaena azotica]MBD2504670.1 hypothetical protein [Anabaena azotica FACHB-119]